MALFRITAKEKHGNMPAGTTLTVDTGGTTSCDPDKIKIAIKILNLSEIFCIR